MQNWPMDGFSPFPLDQRLIAALSGLGIEKPTPVQAAALAAALAGKDMVIQSETGSGKTLCYLLPIMQAILGRAGDGPPVALVIAPTHELASQIAKVAEELAAKTGAPCKVLLAIGSVPMGRLRERLKDKPAIVAGSAGRILELVADRRLKLGALRFIVLDEADRLLSSDMREESAAILSAVPPGTQGFFVSATLGERELTEAKKLLRDPVVVSLGGASASLPGGIAHYLLRCEGRRKLERLRALCAALPFERALVFAKTSGEVLNACMRLREAGLAAGAIHSSFDKQQRRKTLDDFAAGKLRLLVASDIGARGLDIRGIDYAIHLDVPADPLAYAHRAGRTGRAGAAGRSLVLADEYEEERTGKIARKLGINFSVVRIAEGGLEADDAPRQRVTAQGAHRSDAGSGRIVSRGTASGTARGTASGAAQVERAREKIANRDPVRHGEEKGKKDRERTAPTIKDDVLAVHHDERGPAPAVEAQESPKASTKTKSDKKDKKEKKGKKRKPFKKSGGYPRTHDHLSGPSGGKEGPRGA